MVAALCLSVEAKTDQEGEGTIQFVSSVTQWKL